MSNKNDKKIKIIFFARIALWLVALGFTIHWIYWSFYLYSIEIFEVGQYATILRPILYKDLAVSVGCIAVSFFLRWISDQMKKVK